ncbi:hypothetical protein H1O16_gp214 [Burkholderia phage BcepSaruman]|uniref:Uncharacterized protein n=1 Tax=Burkholderia phage BcepSaruman TaxID=2530032 RepID=A0A4D5ZED7_9CAUD|nr:hypothetical protein H1O16_gp214 [Burkholderia phage BcepSaruman]QBX06627.1 hypothetical protein BcepSaruman_214 [Burkholderia phage BcepSaruman]
MTAIRIEFSVQNIGNVVREALRSNHRVTGILVPRRLADKIYAYVRSEQVPGPGHPLYDLFNTLDVNHKIEDRVYQSFGCILGIPMYIEPCMVPEEIKLGEFEAILYTTAFA